MDELKCKRGIPNTLFFAELLLLALMLFIGWKLRIRSLYYVLGIGEVIILTVVLKIVPLLELSANDVLAAAFCMLLNNVVLQLPFLRDRSFTDTAPFILLLLLELSGLVRGIHQRKRGYGIAVGYAVLCCLWVLCIYQKWERFVLDCYLAREGEFGFAVKVFFLPACIVILSVPLVLMIRRFSVLVKKRLIKLQEYSMTYTEIDRSVILVLVLTLGTLSMRKLVWVLLCILPTDNGIRQIPFWPAGDAYEDSLLWTGFSIMIVLIQIIYIRLLAKSISVKEKMRLQEKDFHQLAKYNHELEKNMEDMREIRHDIKNMFLTMGGFVDRSNDAEMKLFYEENIVPFAKQELQKSDLYMKLSRIHSEGMKSFLYFKIMQGIEQDVSIDLLVQPFNMDNIFCIGQTDLIRILGILIDNAVEEAKSCKGTVLVSLKENEREYLFSVSNTVRRQIREKGVIAGTTDKGLGRGNGLLIAEKLMRKYKNVLLNSFFKEEEFVQCLRIEK